MTKRITPVTITLPRTMLDYGSTLPEDMFKWLQKHAGPGIGYWYFDPDPWEPGDNFQLHLTDEDTAILFKLTWCGEDVR